MKITLIKASLSLDKRLDKGREEEREVGGEVGEWRRGKERGGEGR